MAKSKPTRSRCAACGESFTGPLGEHYKRTHQTQCTVLFMGETQRITCYRGENGLWRCPRCNKELNRTPKQLQAHARNGLCPVTASFIHDGDGSANDGTPEPESDREDDEDDEEVRRKLDGSEEDTNIKSNSRSPAHARASSSHAPATPIAVESNKNPKGPPISQFQWAKLHATGVKRPPTPSEVLQATSQRPAKRPTLVKAEPVSPQKSLPNTQASLASSSAPAGPSLTSSRTKPSSYASAGPSERANSSRATTSHITSGLPIPPALEAFFVSTRVPLRHLAHIFIENGFDSDATLDLLCELPPEGNWKEMKDEIIKEGRLAGWLAIQKGLQLRAQALQTR